MIENDLKNYEFSSLEFNFRPLKILNLVHKNLSFDLIYGEVNADKPSLNFKFSNAFRYKNIIYVLELFNSFASISIQGQDFSMPWMKSGWRLVEGKHAGHINFGPADLLELNASVEASSDIIHCHLLLFIQSILKQDGVSIEIGEINKQL